MSSRQQADSNTNFRSARAVSTRNSRGNPSLLLVVTGQLGHYHPNNNKKTRQLLNRKSRVKSRDKRGIASLFCSAIFATTRAINIAILLFEIAPNTSTGATNNRICKFKVKFIILGSWQHEPKPTTQKNSCGSPSKILNFEILAVLTIQIFLSCVVDCLLWNQSFSCCWCSPILLLWG